MREREGTRNGQRAASERVSNCEGRGESEDKDAERRSDSAGKKQKERENEREDEKCGEADKTNPPFCARESAGTS
jgi:hypothetical protein